MATPREILRRAAVRNAARKCPETLQPDKDALRQRTPMPQTVRENTFYRRLMCSHDRVHSRHLRG